MKEPVTLLKLGVLSMPLEQAISTVYPYLYRISSGNSPSFKYGRFEKGESPYLIMLCQPKELLATSLSVTSYSDERNKSIADKLMEQIRFRELANPGLGLREESLTADLVPIFKYLERIPAEMMAVLRGSLTTQGLERLLRETN